MNKVEIYSIESVYNETSCFSVMDVDFKDRCRLAMAFGHCHHIMNFFNYFEMMYCTMDVQSKFEEIAIIGVFIIIVILLMFMIGHVADKYFTSVLKIVSAKMNLNEHLAGAILLSLGNELPDLMVNLMPVREDAPLFTITVSNALAVVLVSGGVICFLRPFQINGSWAIRDLLFLWLSCELCVYVVHTGTHTSNNEALSLILLYVIYLIVIVVDLSLVRLNITSLKEDIKKISKNPSTPDRSRILKEKQTKLHELEMDNKFDTSDRKPMDERSMFRLSRRKSDLNAQATRNVMHSPYNSKNRLLCEEFLESLIPINIIDWRFRGCLGRTCLIVTSPIVFLCLIFVPVVDYQKDKHGWSKLLNCTQIITNPIVFIMLTHAMIAKQYEAWYLTLDFRVGLWTLFVTVPLAIFVFFNSRTDQPPRYHLFFVLLTASGSILIMAICAFELEVLCVIIGLVFHMSENFVAASIRSFATALGDLIINVNLAMQGYEKMAFAAVLAGPLFSITMGMGIACFFNEHADDHGSIYWLYGEHGSNCHVFFILAILSTLFCGLTFNFHARRSVGIFSIILYIIFILYAVLVEWESVHQFSRDKPYKPQ